MRRIFVILRKDGGLKFYGTILLKSPVKGKLVLGGNTYSVNPKLFYPKVVLNWRFKPKISNKAYGFWREDEPEQIDLASDGLSEALTGRMITDLLAEKTLQEMRGGHIASWIPVICFGVGAAAGATLVYIGGM